MKKSGLIINEESCTDWGGDLSEFEHSLFLLPEWILSVESEGCKPLFLDFISEGEVMAKLSGLVCKKGRFKGNWLYCYASPALKKSSSVLLNQCYGALIKYGRKHNISRIIIGSYDQQVSYKCNVPGFYVTSRYEFVVPLKNNSGKINFSQNLKRNIKKAEKNNAKFVEESNEEALNCLLQLLQETRQKRKRKYGDDYNPYYLLNMSKSSLTKLFNSGKAKIYRVYNDEENTLCSIFNIEDGLRCFNLLAGSGLAAYEIGFPSFIDYRVMDLYQAKGYSYYNLGGGTGDAGAMGVDRSKAGKGGVKMEIFGATTNYLLYPGKILNPFLSLGRALPRENRVVYFLKRLFLSN